MKSNKSPKYLILVDKGDNPLGIEEKITAHKKAKLHRAFSILIFNFQGELLIQQRSKFKYHCPGIWANTCCSHPKPDEEIYSAAHRRLIEEMGFECNLKRIFKFQYCTKLGKGLTENEIDHVFIGFYDGDPKPDKDEVLDFEWISLQKIFVDIENNPNKYAIWFKLILKQIKKRLIPFSEYEQKSFKIRENYNEYEI